MIQQVEFDSKRAVIESAARSEHHLYSRCNGRLDTFKIVDKFPNGYIVWNIGRANFPFIGYVPLAKPDPELPYHICTDSLRAIKCDSEETAHNILRQEGRYEVNKEKFLKLLTSDNELKSMGGKQATLNEPHLGYRNIILIKYWPTMYKWEVEICGSGKHIWVYEDEFEID